MAKRLLLSYTLSVVALYGGVLGIGQSQEIASTALRGDLSVYGVGVISLVASSLKLAH